MEPIPGQVSHIILPSTMLNWLSRDIPGKFKLCMGADPDRLRRFWADLFSSSVGQEFRNAHPFLSSGQSPEQLQRCIPITIHEDAAPYSKRRSVTTVSWHSVLGEGSDWETRIMAMTWVSDTDNPLDVTHCWHRLLQDFEQLENGFGDGWSATLLWGIGDLEQTVKWGAPDFRVAGDTVLCPWCNANRTTVPFTDLRPDALFRDPPWLPEDNFQANCRGNHPLRQSRYWNAPLV